MRSGKLRHVGALQSFVIGSPQQNAAGEPSGAWVTIASPHCSIEPLNGRELLVAQQINSEITTRIRLRYREGVTSAMRVSYRSVIYNIAAVIDFELRGSELHLMCTSGLNEG
jgi:SPP1 family predicted phage head-tail adaptor